MTDTTKATPIMIENSNNKFSCDFFTEINFAPSRSIYEHDLEQIFVIKNNDETVFVQVVDYFKLPFKSIRSTDTLPATGLFLFPWQKKWKEKYPKTTDETIMAIYFYQKIK